MIFREQRSGNTLYQELSFQDVEVLNEVDEGADITGINLNDAVKVLTNLMRLIQHC